MSETKHTPGPWNVDLDREFIQGSDQVSVEALSPDGSLVTREVCTLFLDTGENKDGDSYEEDAANARLIAAAPELLEALKALRSEVVGAIGIGISDSIGNTNTKCLGDRCQQAFEAIARAEGRPTPEPEPRS